MRKKISKVDILIIIFCLAGACLSGAAFWREYNHTLVKLNEEPVATIIFKKRIAQRKFVERNVWDRLKQTSPVYNGDTIRTIEQAEAVIIFEDKITYLNMDESTMIQVTQSNQGRARIDFTGGNLEVISENEDLEISSGDSKIVIAGQVRMNKGEEDFILSVSGGTASFDGKEVETGGILALDANGNASTKPIIAMTSFGSSAYVLGSPAGMNQETVPVEFAWNTLNFSSGNYVVVEIASDRRFGNIVESREVRGASSVSIALRNGNYWWRAYPAGAEPSAETQSTAGETRVSGAPPGGFFPSGTLEVIPAVPVRLLSPRRGEEFIFPSDPVVSLSWSKVENASAYLLEISANADMSNSVVSRSFEGNSVSQGGLDFGSWYWRVTPVFPLRIKGSGTPSATGDFQVVQGDPQLAAPALSFPPQNGKIYLGSPKNYLLWVHDPKAASWIIEIADNPGMANPKIKESATRNYFSLPKEQFQEGSNWYWRLTAMGTGNPAVSDVWNFSVSLGTPPVAKPVLTTETYIPLSEPIVFGTRIEDWDDLDAVTIASNERILSQIVQTLNTNTEYKVRVEGHANYTVDPSDIAGRQYEYTQELQPISEVRARAVMNQLVARGIDPSRLEYRGFGGEHPVAAWEDVDNWWKNRRVEFVLIR